ncbi:MAG: hypothetical protein H6Q36_163 [Chloroflexi bacterium]|nr:hypothetical protein [Chloroflexota bacterium]
MAARDRSSDRRPRRVWHSLMAVLAAASLLLTGAALSPAVAGKPTLDGGEWQTRPVELRAKVRPAAAARYAKEHPRKAHQALPKRSIKPAGGGPPTRPSSAPATLTVRAAEAESGALAAVVPPVVASPTFAGIANADQADSYEPPDPWVAVGPSHVLQVVNGLVRISSRSGAEIVTVPNWAFFGLGPAEVDADPRIVYDDYHDRWVGVLVSYLSDNSFASNYLNLAVSETSDPTGAWSIYWLTYDQYLPDYPGLASSSDKIVLSANEFEYNVTFSGASITVIPWSQILSGTLLEASYALWDTVWTIRPAQVLSPSADVHLVASDAGSGSFAPHEILYARVSGSATAPTLTEWSSAGAGLDWDTAYVCDPQPRQPGSPATIANAVDARVTDAVWRNGQLWIVHTYPWSYDGGNTCDLRARVANIVLSAGVPVGSTAWAIGEDGHDAFFPGIGIAGDGTVFVVYSLSSATDYVSTYAVAYSPAYNWTDPLLLAAGEGTYAGTRWGDYVGVAADPSATAAAWQANEIPTADGSWRTVVSRLLFDVVPPGAPGAPNQVLVSNTTVWDTVPVKVSWSAATDPGSGSGIGRYELEAVTGGSYNLYPISTGTATSVTQRHWWGAYGSSDGRLMQYRVRAVDGYGNVGPWATGSSLKPTIYDQATSTTYSGTWRTASSSSYYKGTSKYSSTAGASATFTFSGRSVGFLTYRGPTRGKVKVYVDNVLKKTVTLTSSTSMPFRIVYATGWSTSGSHRIKLVVSSGRVDIDGFVVLK